MASGKRPTHRVCVSEEGANGDPFYTDVGSGWTFSSSKAKGVSVKLRPKIAVSGEIVLFEVKEGEQ